MYPEEIMSFWNIDYHNYCTKCPIQLCQNEFIAKFQVIDLELKYNINELESISSILKKEAL